MHPPQHLWMLRGGHPVQDRGRNNEVEPAQPRRQVLCSRELEAEIGAHPPACRFDHRSRIVDADDRESGITHREALGERAVAAAHIEDFVAVVERQALQEGIVEGAVVRAVRRVQGGGPAVAGQWLVARIVYLIFMAGGLLMVLMEPPADLQQAFHDWFDDELVPDHLAIEGFVGASRWVCVEGWPRFMSMYDVDRVAVLEEQDYRSITGENFTAWSHWMLGRVFGRQRLVLASAEAAFRATAEESNGLVLMRFRGHLAAEIGAAVHLLELPAPCGARLYETAAGVPETALLIDAPALALVPVWPAAGLAAALGPSASALLGVWRYVRYRRSQRVWRWADLPTNSTT